MVGSRLTTKLRALPEGSALYKSTVQYYTHVNIATIHHLNVLLNPTPIMNTTVAKDSKDLKLQLTR